MSLEDVKELRLSINDPQGYNDLIEVAEMDDLPAAHQPQTAYYVTAVGGFFATEKLTGATEADYELVEVFYSNLVYKKLIDTLGLENAICRSFHIISRKLFGQLGLVRSTAGSEVTEYQRLRDVYLYYRDLAADCKKDKDSDAGTNTGRIGYTTQPEIAGGLL
jgi:hypothetical protein